MKTLLKEYRKLLLVVALPYLVVVVASIIRVDYDITAPGDLNEVREVISVETNYDKKFLYRFLVSLMTGLPF